MGEMDAATSRRLGGRLVGPDGPISPRTVRKVVFCGAFETKRLGVEVDAVGTLTTIRAGDVPKLVQKNTNVRRRGRTGRKSSTNTERTRFRLGADAAAVFNSATPP